MKKPRPISHFKFTEEEYQDYLNGKEIWRDVPDYEGIYQVSTHGRAKSMKRIVNMPNKLNGNLIKEKIMKQSTNQFGYTMMNLQKDKSQWATVLHRICAITFLHNPENKEEVNHIDGVKANNFLYNLEMNTRSENILHSFRIGIRIPTCLGRFGKDHMGSKPILQIDKNTGEIIQRYEGLMDAARETGFEFKNMSACALGKRATCMGYRWKYEEDL